MFQKNMNQKQISKKKDVLFEIAYSYAEIENDVKSEKLYLKILKKDKNNSSVLNNLGIIYEKQGKIDKALEHLQKAESINHNETHIRNIKRCNITLEEKKKNQEEIIKGKENIKKENVFIINKFLSFCEHQNDSGDIICSYSELPIFLNINAEKANEVLNTFLRKKYLFKQINHSYDTNKSVYKINNDVESEIINIKNNNKLMNDVANKLNNISLEKMENMNLNEKFSKISSITNTEICSILKRDYYELFMAYTIDEEVDEEEINVYSFKDLTNTQYIYTFKTLGAQSYDNFLAMWTLNTLAEKENRNLKFEFSKEKFNFRLEQPNDNVKWTEDFPDTITRLFEKIGIYIKYESSEEVRQQFNTELVQYEKARRSEKIRNQELFKNNLRAKGLQTKCYLCGCEVEEILEAAHLWGVADIKSSESTKINKVIEIDCMKKLLLDPVHSSEQFYKKYVLANSGDNGIWLCNNHHELFDRNYYCFNSENGKVLLKADSDEILKII